MGQSRARVQSSPGPGPHHAGLRIKTDVQYHSTSCLSGSQNKCFNFREYPGPDRWQGGTGHGWTDSSFICSKVDNMKELSRRVRLWVHRSIMAERTRYWIQAAEMGFI
ncbi:hypothetical protein AMECASPLE_026978 [Ameca splendens]|uniref:Uncharacterized protein n=1 Tax=Ameca splendens TaxID=208324 RepID=A0ABV0YGU5_9TELE